ncbi:MAG TPA: phosphoserine phosphatase SerB, partial [Streptosporangiaceae bacterium]|nr:phosphoserine phosphatase SerB [Streptosporangiaceae bacterium]
MNTSRTTLLITLTGRDRPGVTSRLFGGLARYQLTVADIEQVVIRGKLVLGVLLECDGPPDLTGIHTVVSALAADLGLEAEITAGSGSGSAGDAPARGGRLHVTLLGSPLTPAAITAIAGRIAASGANIDRIGRLARRPVTCIELEISGGDPALLREDLARVAVSQGIDVAVQRGGLHRRAMRLVVMDVDSTLISAEVIDLLAARAGCAEQVAKITTAAMGGEADFAASLRERVALLAGLDAGVLDEVRAEVQLAPGARTLIRTLQHLGFRCGIVSGGFTQLTDGLAAGLGLDYAAANTLEIAGGKLTGKLTGPVIDRAGKAAALRQFADQAGVPLSQTVAVGDGANDLDMIAAAGMGIAFNAKQAVRDAADASVSVPYLDTVLYLLGVSRDEVEAGDSPQALTWHWSRPGPGSLPCARDPEIGQFTATGRRGGPAFAEPDDRKRARGKRDVQTPGEPGDQLPGGRVVPHRQHGGRAVRLLVDAVQQVL